MFKVDSKAVLVELINNRTSDELERTYLVLLNRIKVVVIIPKKHSLDNECSDNMKKLIRKTC